MTAPRVQGSATAQQGTDSCDCIEIVNKDLADAGAMVKTSRILSGIGTTNETWSLRVSIGAQKIDTYSRRRLPVLIAQFCPFCGTRYRADDGETVPPTDGTP